MWNFKNLFVSIVFAICALTCAFSFFFRDGGDLGSFSSTGMIVFAFISFIFIRNAKK